MYQNKKALVVGVARSGIGAANLLVEEGSEVVINDIKEKEQLENQLGLLDKRVKKELGCKADGLVSGRDLIVVSPGVPTSLSFFAEAAKQDVPVISEVELAYTVCKAKIAAITGTNGKTTTTALAGEIFKKFKGESFVVGNIGDAFANKALEMKEDSMVALEASSFQLETVKTFKPKVSAILNITEDHLQRHKTMEEYIRCKKRIFENQSENDYLILNYDDETLRKIEKEGKCKKIFFSKNDIPGDCVCVKNDNIIVKYAAKEETICPVGSVSMPGIHNLENMLAAAAISYFYGADIESIAYTLQNFKGVEHRLEFVAEHNGIRYINDSKGTNTDATIWAVRAMDMPTIIILGGYDKGIEFDGLIKEFNQYIAGVVIIGETKTKIAATLDKYNFTNYKTADKFEEAVYTALGMAQAGYSILLSPASASYDMFKDFEERGRVFKKIVAEIKEN